MKASWINLLETGTVTITSAATGYDGYRLYDRILGLMWRATSTSTQTILVDQGASPAPVNLLVVSADHNLDGCTLAWQRSSDGVSNWTDIVTSWTQSGSAQIVKQPASPVTYRYLRLTIAGASVAPEAGEVWMGQFTEFMASPDFDARRGLKYGVEREETPGGVAYYLQLGSPRLSIEYTVPLIDSTERTTFESWFSSWNGSNPFFFEDHRGAQFFAEFRQEPMLKDSSPGRSATDLSILQVL